MSEKIPNIDEIPVQGSFEGSDQPKENLFAVGRRPRRLVYIEGVTRSAPHQESNDINLPIEDIDSSSNDNIDEMIADMPDELRRSAIDRYGVAGLRSILNGEKAPSALADTQSEMNGDLFRLTHASTGERMSVADTRARMAEVEDSRNPDIGLSIAEGAARFLDTRDPRFSFESLTAPSGEEVIKVSGELDPTHKVGVELTGDGDVIDVAVETSDIGTDDIHETHVIEVRTDSPDKILLDGEPVSDEALESAQAVLEYTAEEMNSATESESMDQEYGNEEKTETDKVINESAEIVTNSVHDEKSDKTPEQVHESSSRNQENKNEPIDKTVEKKTNEKSAQRFIQAAMTKVPRQLLAREIMRAAQMYSEESKVPARKVEADISNRILNGDLQIDEATANKLAAAIRSNGFHESSGAIWRVDPSDRSIQARIAVDARRLVREVVTSAL